MLLTEQLREGSLRDDCGLRQKAADRIAELQAALRKIADGREVRRDDGTTEIEDVEDAAAIARAALG